MSPPTTSLGLRPSYAPLALWWEELRRAESRQDVRSELFALNAVLKAYGPPVATFGSVSDAVPVGVIVLRRAELCVLGLHRHFLSGATFSLQGLESLLLLGDERCEDSGERIDFAGGGQTDIQAEALRQALRTSANARRAVRVVRAVAASAVEECEDDLASAGRGGLLYRYDGLYYVQRAQAGLEDDDEEPRFELQRAPNQPPLAAGAGGGGGSRRGGGGEAEREPTTLSMHGELSGRGASAELPGAAEALLGGEQRSVGEALATLRAARDELLRQLKPAEAYLLARRSLLNQARLRSAIELLHAGDEMDEAEGGEAPCAKVPRRVSWQT
jgi:hypothetical protein